MTHDNTLTEKIVSIVDTTKKIDNLWIVLSPETNPLAFADGFDGFLITTTEQHIFMGISNGQSCCEETGYFMSEDNLSDFVGATLLDVKITDIERNKEKHVDIYEGGVLFVDIETDRGVLQFVAYNAHNGYYGHEAIVQSKQLKHEVVL